VAEYRILNHDIMKILKSIARNIHPYFETRITDVNFQINETLDVPF
jgi:hypothetical protein